MTGPEDFAYELPSHFIAQEPAWPRDSSRLLTLSRDGSREPVHGVFTDLPQLLDPGDLLVANDSRVLAARFQGELAGGRCVEIMLLRPVSPSRWQALVRPGRKVQPGTNLLLRRFPTSDERAQEGGRGSDPSCVQATVEGDLGAGTRELVFPPDFDVEAFMEQAGVTPLPPYIRKEPGRAGSYQTVYANTPGSAAAPTAGLHFTKSVMRKLDEKRVGLVFLTLDVGIDTFRPIRGGLGEHRMHGEKYTLGQSTADRVNKTLENGGRVVAVGTSAVRALETSAIRRGGSGDYRVAAGSEMTELFIKPGYNFRVVRGVLTNFHMPGSTTLVLAAAFAGVARIKETYEDAKEAGYRFCSFGDAMVIL